MKLLVQPTDIVYKEKQVNYIENILNFIVETYPVKDYPKVLEIAAGNGKFANYLAEKGYRVTAMDPRLEHKDDVNYEELTESFTEYTDISSYDLGIAIHPCGIHKAIINNFCYNEKALFLIPCCTFSCGNPELSYYGKNQNWLRRLEKLNPKMKKKIFSDEAFDSFGNAFYMKEGSNNE